jgi:uncharacterized protein YjbJ (UPF0337 family)
MPGPARCDPVAGLVERRVDPPPRVGIGHGDCGRSLPRRAMRSVFFHHNAKELPHMNWDRIEGNWKQMKGKVKEKWGKLTDDQLDVIAGKRDQLLGRIQEAYGCSRDEAERQVRDFETHAGSVERSA